MWEKLPTLFIIGAVVAVGVFFFLIVQPFILPLILAAVLAVLFWPWYKLVRRLCRGHAHIAAALTTLLILLIVLVPVGTGLTLAGAQLVTTAQQLEDDFRLTERWDELTSSDSPVAGWLESLRTHLPDDAIQQARQMLTSAIAGTARTVYERTTRLAANVIGFVIGLVVLSLGLYYFLAEKDQLLTEVRRLSPFDADDDVALGESFVRVCRGVLLGSVLAAFIQAILNGIGFAVAGVSHVWVLALLTFFLSMIPYLGAASVWSIVVIGLAIDGRYWAAGLLAIYGLAIVSSVDNLIRAYAIHDRSRIHPLIAFISILGAIQLTGLWGIIIGPVAAALFHALLELLHRKMNAAGNNDAAGNDTSGNAWSPQSTDGAVME